MQVVVQSTFDRIPVNCSAFIVTFRKHRQRTGDESEGELIGPRTTSAEHAAVQKDRGERGRIGGMGPDQEVPCEGCGSGEERERAGSKGKTAVGGVEAYEGRDNSGVSGEATTYELGMDFVGLG